MSPADLLAEAGRAMYGDKWLMRLSRDLNVSDETMGRWMNGRVELRADHGVLVDAAALLRKKAQELVAAAEAIEALAISGAARSSPAQ